MVLDDAHPVTRDWHFLNSRVFDALACGELVLTHCRGGAEELFGGRLPNFGTHEKLQAQLRHYLDHPEERETLAATLHDAVLANQTYENRAATFRGRLLELLDGSLRFAIKIGVPDMGRCEQWGDYHFALSIKRALDPRGHVARVDILPDWYGGLTAGADVVIVLRGLSPYQPQPTTINLMRLISHPDDVNLTEMQQYHVFVASARLPPGSSRAWASRSARCCNAPTRPCSIRSATRARGAGHNLRWQLPRHRARSGAILSVCLAGGVDFAVHGGMGEGILSASRVRATYLPNASLRHDDSATKVVLDHHWTDMRTPGFVLNRLLRCGHLNR